MSFWWRSSNSEYLEWGKQKHKGYVDNTNLFRIFIGPP